MQQRRTRRTTGRSLGALWLVACLSAALGHAASPDIARADPGMHSFRLEGGLGLPVTDPQTARFDLGGGGTLGYELRPIPWLSLEARAAGYWFPSSAARPTPEGFGSYYALGLGFRLHPLAGLGVGDLWVGAAGAVAFTGGLVRPGLDVGIGYELDVTAWLRIGPVARYHHVFQTEAGADAGFVTIGLALSLGGDEPGLDRDRDGVLDADDGCPDEPEDVDAWEDADGCPDPDNDADTILDASDACPNEAEDRDGFEDDDGCAEADNDEDRIPDATDQCPIVAEDRDGDADDDGCPEGDTDTDGDGLLDGDDACPSEPETQNGYEDADGCPDAPPVRTEQQIQTEIQLDQLGERILFVRSRVRVLPSSRAALASVIALLQAHPDITRVTVEAHASEDGESGDNMTLSERRAERVIQELVAGGVDPARLVARAYGEQRPEIPEAHTEEEHAANRRVLFFVERTATPAP